MQRNNFVGLTISLILAGLASWANNVDAKGGIVTDGTVGGKGAFGHPQTLIGKNNRIEIPEIKSNA